MYSLKEGSKFEDFALIEALSDITEAVSKSTGKSHVQQLRNYSFLKFARIFQVSLVLNFGQFIIIVIDIVSVAFPFLEFLIAVIRLSLALESKKTHIPNNVY